LHQHHHGGRATGHRQYQPIDATLTVESTPHFLAEAFHFPRRAGKRESPAQGP
jgi:hypothetical protein